MKTSKLLDKLETQGYKKGQALNLTALEHYQYNRNYALMKDEIML